ALRAGTKNALTDRDHFAKAVRTKDIPNPPRGRDRIREKQRFVTEKVLAMKEHRNAQDGMGRSSALGPNTPAPDFKLHSTPDQLVALSDFRGQPVILAFYPA